MLHTPDLEHKDTLTHLLDWRGFQEACTLLSAGAVGHGATITYAMIDLDQFSMINDWHGVAVDNRALCHVADLLRMHLRPIDQAARIGGDQRTWCTSRSAALPQCYGKPNTERLAK